MVGGIRFDLGNPELDSKRWRTLKPISCIYASTVCFQTSFVATIGIKVRTTGVLHGVQRAPCSNPGAPTIFQA